MHGGREGAGVDVILQQQHLGLCVAVPDGPQRAHVVAGRVGAVRLPAVYRHHYALVCQRGRLEREQAGVT